MVSTSVSTSATADTLVGDLTINGVTKSVELDVEYHGVAVDGYETTRAGFSASGTIKRSDFGMKYALKGIGDEVQIMLEIEAVKK